MASSAASSTSSPPADQQETTHQQLLPPVLSSLPSIIQQLSVFSSNAALVHEQPRHVSLLLITLRQICLTTPAAQSAARQRKAFHLLYTLLQHSLQHKDKGRQEDEEKQREIMLLLRHILLTLTALLYQHSSNTQAFTHTVSFLHFYHPLISLGPIHSILLTPQQWSCLCIWIAWSSIAYLPQEELTKRDNVMELLITPSPSNLLHPALLPLPLHPYMLLLHPSALLPLFHLLPRSELSVHRRVLYWILSVLKTDTTNAQTLAVNGCIPTIITAYRELLLDRIQQREEEAEYSLLRTDVWRVIAALLRWTNHRRDLKAILSLMQDTAHNTSSSSTQQTSAIAVRSSRRIVVLDSLLESIQQLESSNLWPYIHFTIHPSLSAAETEAEAYLALSPLKATQKNFPPDKGYTFSVWLYIEESNLQPTPTTTSNTDQLDSNATEPTSSSSSSAADTSGPSTSALFSAPESLPALPRPYLSLLTILSSDGKTRLCALIAATHLVLITDTNKSILSSSSSHTHSIAIFDHCSFRTHQWYHITVKHTSTALFSAASAATLYVDGEFVQTLALAYLHQPSHSATVTVEIGNTSSLLNVQFGRKKKTGIPTSPLPSAADVQLRYRIAGVLLADLVLNDMQIHTSYRSQQTHKSKLLTSSAAVEAPAAAAVAPTTTPAPTATTSTTTAATALSSPSSPATSSIPAVDWRYLAAHTSASHHRFATSTLNELDEDAPARDELHRAHQHQVHLQQQHQQHAPTAAPPAVVPLDHYLFYLYPAAAYLQQQSTAIAPMPAVYFNNVVRLYTGSGSCIFSDAQAYGHLHLFQPYSFITQYKANHGLSHLLLLISHTTDSHSLIRLLQLLLYLLAGDPDTLAQFEELKGTAVLAAVVEEHPECVDRYVIDGLYALIGLTHHGTHGTIVYLSAFSILFIHTLFLLPTLTLLTRIYLYQPLIAALLTNPHREENVRIMRELQLIPWLLSLFTAQLIPLKPSHTSASSSSSSSSSSTPAAATTIPTTMVEATTDTDAAGPTSPLHPYDQTLLLLNVCEQWKDVLFLMFAEGLIEKEVRAIAYFILNDNQATMTAAAGYTASVKPLTVEEQVDYWVYETAVKNILLELMLGVMLNMYPLTASSSFGGSGSSSSSTSLSASNVTSPGTSRSPSPRSSVVNNPPSITSSGASSSSASTNHAFPSPSVARNKKVFHEILFPSLFQPSYLIALLTNIQQAADRIHHLVTSHQYALPIDYNASVRAVLFLLKLLITLTIRYPNYYQFMQQEMGWIGLSAVLAYPALSALTPEASSSLSPFTALLCGSYNVMALLASLMLGREVDGYVSALPLFMASSPLKLSAPLADSSPAPRHRSSFSAPVVTLMMDEHINPLLQIYQEAMRDNRYKLHVAAPDVIPVLLLMCSSHAQHRVVAVAESATTDLHSPLLYHTAEFLSTLIQHCLDFRIYVSHASQPLLQQVAAALFTHAAVAVRFPEEMLDEVQKAWRNDNKAHAEQRPQQPSPHQEQQQAIQKGSSAHDRTSASSPAPSADAEYPATDRPVSTHHLSVVVPYQSFDNRHERRSDDNDGHQLETDEFERASTGPVSSAPSTPSTVSPQVTEPILASEHLSPINTPRDIESESSGSMGAAETPERTPSPSVDEQQNHHAVEQHPPPLQEQQQPSIQPPISYPSISPVPASTVYTFDHAAHHRTATGNSLADELMDAEDAQDEKEDNTDIQAGDNEDDTEEPAEEGAEELELAAEREVEQEDAAAALAELQRQEQQRAEQQAAAAALAAKAEQIRQQQEAEYHRYHRDQTMVNPTRATAVTALFPFTDPTSKMVFSFFAEIVVLSLTAPRPHSSVSSSGSGSSSHTPGSLSPLPAISISPRSSVEEAGAGGPVICKKLDTGIEGYDAIKMPHVSGQTVAKAQAWTILYDILSFAPLPVLHDAIRLPAVQQAYQTQLLTSFMQIFLSDIENWGRTLATNTTFALNFAQICHLLLSKLRSGMFRGGGVLMMEVLGQWLATPEFQPILAIYSAGSASTTSTTTTTSTASTTASSKKHTEDQARMVHVLLATLHSIILFVYAEGLGVDLYAIIPSSKINSALRNDMDLIWVNSFLAQHPQLIIAPIMQTQKYHALVGCLLQVLFAQLWEEEDLLLSPRSALAKSEYNPLEEQEEGGTQQQKESAEDDEGEEEEQGEETGESTSAGVVSRPRNGRDVASVTHRIRHTATQVFIQLASHPNAVPYLTDILCGKHLHLSLTESFSIPQHLTDLIRVGLSILSRGDGLNFSIWATHSQSTLQPALGATIGLHFQQFCSRMEREKRIQQTLELKYADVRIERMMMMFGKEQQARVEIQVRMKLLEQTVRDKMMNSEKEKRMNARKEKKVNVKIIKKKLEQASKQAEQSKQQAGGGATDGSSSTSTGSGFMSRPLSMAVWNQLASGTMAQSAEVYALQARFPTVQSVTVPVSAAGQTGGGGIMSGRG